MKGKNRSFVLGVGISLFCVTYCADSAFGDIAKVVANLLDGNADTSFDGTTLRVQQNGFPTSDPLLLRGPGDRFDFTNIAIELVVEYQGVGAFPGGTPFGIFGNGHIGITFEDQQGTYELSGPVEILKMETRFVTTGENPTTEFSGGAGLFQPTTAIMPVDYDWVVPDFPGGPFSVIDQVNIVIDGALEDYDWSAPTPWGQGESAIVLFPASIPEPMQIGPLLVVSLFVARKRRWTEVRPSSNKCGPRLDAEAFRRCPREQGIGVVFADWYTARMKDVTGAWLEQSSCS